MNAPDATLHVTKWLADFSAALTRGDIEAAVALFAEESYWRDLIAFTWNIKTLEGKPAIKAMLEATLARVRPSNWIIDGAASSTDGITDARFTFETEIARGKGRVRLKGGKCWTLLTVMMELKGHEEKRGESRELGV